MPESKEWYDQHPHARMSYTRLATYERCPAWYRYQYLEWHRTWSTPVLTAGHMVQDCLQAVFDGRPALDVSLESLQNRALDRALKSFEERWDKARFQHEADPNGFGAWDLPKERYVDYLRQGLSFHVQEVSARLARRHPRSGKELDLSELGTVSDAWVAVRPWHAKEGVFDLESIPAGWFQGQYDLVYSWTGGRRIIDLKASAGTSPFSTEIERQLLGYAWMERELGRGLPEGLEGWFLGRPEPHVVPIPTEPELEAFGQAVLALIARSKSEGEFGAWNAADFPPDPAALTSHQPLTGEPSAWCSYCPAAFSCERTSRAAPEVGAPGSVEGLVMGLGPPRDDRGRTKRRFTIVNRAGAKSFKWDELDMQRFIQGGLRAGRVVRFQELNPWKPPRGGEPMLFSTKNTRVEVLAMSHAGTIADPEDRESS